MKEIRGFTLLEILIVVVILGILASLAIPRYQVSVEKAKGSEAVANINILRGAELRYYTEYDWETNVLTDLDVESPQSNPRRYFNYSIQRGAILDDANFTITATRAGGMLYNGYTIIIDQDGAYSGTWPFLP